MSSAPAPSALSAPADAGACAAEEQVYATRIASERGWFHGGRTSIEVGGAPATRSASETGIVHATRTASEAGSVSATRCASETGIVHATRTASEAGSVAATPSDKGGSVTATPATQRGSSNSNLVTQRGSSNSNLVSRLGLWQAGSGLWDMNKSLNRTLSSLSRLMKMKSWKLESMSVPWEVKQDFRTKALVLAVLESLAVLGLIVSCDFVFKPNMKDLSTPLFGVLIVLTLALFAFWFMRQRYPTNYILLFFITLLAGVFWVIMDASAFQDDLDLPMQMSLIMVVLQGTWLICMRVECEDDCRPIVGGALLGLIAGVCVNALVVMMRSLPWSTLGVSGLAMACCTLGMLITVGDKFARCRVDDYMYVVFSLTVSLFFVVSGPLFFVIWGFGMNCHAVEGFASGNGRPKDDDEQLSQGIASV